MIFGKKPEGDPRLWHPARRIPPFYRMPDGRWRLFPYGAERRLVAGRWEYRELKPTYDEWLDDQF